MGDTKNKGKAVNQNDLANIIRSQVETIMDTLDIIMTSAVKHTATLKYLKGFLQSTDIIMRGMFSQHGILSIFIRNKALIDQFANDKSIKQTIQSFNDILSSLSKIGEDKMKVSIKHTIKTLKLVKRLLKKIFSENGPIAILNNRARSISKFANNGSILAAITTFENFLDSLLAIIEKSQQFGDIKKSIKMFSGIRKLIRSVFSYFGVIGTLNRRQNIANKFLANQSIVPAIMQLSFIIDNFAAMAENMKIIGNSKAVSRRINNTDRLIKALFGRKGLIKNLSKYEKRANKFLEGNAAAESIEKLTSVITGLRTLAEDALVWKNIKVSIKNAKRVKYFTKQLWGIIKTIIKITAFGPLLGVFTGMGPLYNIAIGITLKSINEMFVVVDYATRGLIKLKLFKYTYKQIIKAMNYIKEIMETFVEQTKSIQSDIKQMLMLVLCAKVISYIFNTFKSIRTWGLKRKMKKIAQLADVLQLVINKYATLKKVNMALRILVKCVALVTLLAVVLTTFVGIGGTAALLVILYPIIRLSMVLAANLISALVKTLDKAIDEKTKDVMKKFVMFVAELGGLTEYIIDLAEIVVSGVAVMAMVMLIGAYFILAISIWILTKFLNKVITKKALNALDNYNWMIVKLLLLTTQMVFLGLAAIPALLLSPIIAAYILLLWGVIWALRLLATALSKGITKSVIKKIWVLIQIITLLNILALEFVTLGLLSYLAIRISPVVVVFLAITAILVVGLGYIGKLISKQRNKLKKAIKGLLVVALIMGLLLIVAGELLILSTTLFLISKTAKGGWFGVLLNIILFLGVITGITIALAYLGTTAMKMKADKMLMKAAYILGILGLLLLLLNVIAMELLVISISVALMLKTAGGNWLFLIMNMIGFIVLVIGLVVVLSILGDTAYELKADKMLLKCILILTLTLINMTLLVVLSIELVVVAVCAAVITPKFGYIMGLLLLVTLMVGALSLLGLAAQYVLAPLALTIVLIASLVIVVTLMIVLALELLLLEQITLDVDKIRKNITDIIGLTGYIMYSIFAPSETDADGKPSDRNVLETIFAWAGGAVAKVMGAIMSFAYLALMMAAVLMMLILAGELKLIEMIDLNPEKIKTNIDTILKTANDVVEVLFGTPDKDNKESDKSWIQSVLEWAGGTVFKIAVAIMSIAYLATTIVSLLLITMIAGELLMLQKIELDPEKIAANVELVLSTAESIGDIIFGEPKHDNKESTKDWIMAVFEWAGGTFLKMAKTAMALSYLAITLVSIALITFIAEELKSLGEVELNTDNITEKVNAVLAAADEIVSVIFDPKPTTKSADGTTTTNTTDTSDDSSWFEDACSWLGGPLLKVAKFITRIGNLALTVICVGMIAKLAEDIKSLSELPDVSDAKDNALKVIEIGEELIRAVMTGEGENHHGAKSSLFASAERNLKKDVRQRVQTYTILIQGINDIIGIMRGLNTTDDLSPQIESAKTMIATCEDLLMAVIGKGDHHGAEEGWWNSAEKNLGKDIAERVNTYNTLIDNINPLITKVTALPATESAVSIAHSCVDFIKESESILSNILISNGGIKNALKSDMYLDTYYEIYDIFEDIYDEIEGVKPDKLMNIVEASKSLYDTSEQILRFLVSRESVDTGIIKKRFDIYSDLFDKIRELSDIKPMRARAAVKVNESVIAMVDKINDTNTEKLVETTKLFGQMARFSESINGNFDGLAEALKEKLLPTVEKLEGSMTNMKDSMVESESHLKAVKDQTKFLSEEAGYEEKATPEKNTATAKQNRKAKFEEMDVPDLLREILYELQEGR